MGTGTASKEWAVTLTGCLASSDFLLCVCSCLRQAVSFKIPFSWWPFHRFSVSCLRYATSAGYWLSLWRVKLCYPRAARCQSSTVTRGGILLGIKGSPGCLMRYSSRDKAGTWPWWADRSRADMGPWSSRTTNLRNSLLCSDIYPSLSCQSP